MNLFYIPCEIDGDIIAFAAHTIYYFSCVGMMTSAFLFSAKRSYFIMENDYL